MIHVSQPSTENVYPYLLEVCHPFGCNLPRLVGCICLVTVYPHVSQLGLEVVPWGYLDTYKYPCNEVT